MDFKGRVAIITGAGGGLGRAYALYLASLGAAIVVNDLGGTLTGETIDKSLSNSADKVVSEIQSKGGIAVADRHNIILNPELIIQTAISNFGRLDILINNAGIIRDRSFIKMTLKDWSSVVDVHLNGSFLITKAAWPYMVRQKYGRIIMTASAAGIYGNFGQANYSAAKMGLVGFARSLALEGIKYNITCNVVSPLASTRISETALPADILKNLTPESIAPVVAYLVHQNSSLENGSLFETAGGVITKLRYQRSPGVFVNCHQENGTLFYDLLSKLKDLSYDPKDPNSYPKSIQDVSWIEYAQKNSQILKFTPSVPILNQKDILKNKVIIITGASGGLGKAYALYLSSLGASILINDLNHQAANELLKQITSHNGKAVVNFDNIITDGHKIIEHAIKSFDCGGKIDALINNAGVLQDFSFSNQTSERWKKVIDVHLHGTFSLCHAIWPIFVKQKYGNIINTTSAVALYGNFGQTNYAAAKAAIIGLSKTLSIEGSRYNIKVNVIAPNAGTAMTATIMPPEIVELLQPKMVAPLVAILASNQYCPTSGSIYEVGSGWFSMVRIERSIGINISNLSLPEINKIWGKVNDFSLFSPDSYPQSAQDSLKIILGQISGSNSNSLDKSKGLNLNSNVDNDQKAKKESTNRLRQIPFDKPISTHLFSYSNRDLILYALSIGCSENQLSWVYENDPSFEAFPTFGVIPALSALFDQGDNDSNSQSQSKTNLAASIPKTGTKWIDFVPEFNLSTLLHGEQKLEIFNEIPTGDITLESETKIKSIQEKNSNLIIVLKVDSRNKSNGKLLFSNEVTIILRGVRMNSEQTNSSYEDQTKSHVISESQSVLKPKPANTNIASFKADSMKTKFQTRADQAVLYRLNGDKNPLHIDPSFAKLAGFQKPILHGLCTFGITARLIMEKYGSGNNKKLRMITGRFSKPVFPGQTLEVHHSSLADLTNNDELKLRFQVDIDGGSEPVLVGGEALLSSKSYNLTQTPNISMKSRQENSEVIVSSTKTFILMDQGWKILSDQEKSELISKFNAILKFDIKNQDPIWLILKSDSKQLGFLKNSDVKNLGLNPDLTLLLDEESLLSLIQGSLSPQQAFIKGKVKIIGKMGLAMNLEVILKKLRKSASSKL